MWSCDFMNNNKMKKFRTSYPITTALNPRDALYGGRTEVFSTYKKITNTLSCSRMNYFDIMSLYPSVNLFDDYPINHETRYYNQKKWKTDWFGLAKISILPPRKLYHPVLPMKINNKLIFTLCYKCAEINNQNICNHLNNDRELHGTWSTIEINKAIELGYKIPVGQIHEVWDFKKRSNEIFAG